MYKFKYCRYRSNNCTSILSLSHSIIDATSRLSRNRDPVGNMLLICRSFVPRSTCLNCDTNCYSGRGGLQQGSVPDSGRPCWSRGRGVPARHSNAKGMFAVSCFMSNNFSHERLLSIELIVLSDRRTKKSKMTNYFGKSRPSKLYLAFFFTKFKAFFLKALSN